MKKSNIDRWKRLGNLTFAQAQEQLQDRDWHLYLHLWIYSTIRLSEPFGTIREYYLRDCGQAALEYRQAKLARLIKAIKLS